MAKKKGLPFVVQPRLKPIVERVGTEDSGIIEIERKGYLTVGEKAMVQSAMQNAAGLAEVFVKARSIGAQAGKTGSEVLEDISKDPAPQYLEIYEAEVGWIVNTMIAHEQRQRLVCAVALIVSRIDPEWDATQPLHPDIEEGLYRLYKDEENRSLDALEASAEKASKAQENAKGKD